MRFPKLPVPDARPSDEPTEQLCINHDWVVVLISVIDRLRYPASWQSVSDETQLESKVLELVKMMVEAKAMGCGCGCGETTNPTRYNEDGELEVYDPVTGEWIPFPQGDPRQTGTIMPPLPGADGDNKRCEAATNATQHLKDLADKLIADAGAWGNISQLVAAILGILIFVGVIGSGGALTPLLLALAGILLTTGQAAFTAAMTAEVYDTLNCILFCNIQPDASFTDADIADIKAEIDNQLTGVAKQFLYENVNMLGKVGMTNAARTANSRVFDCDTCECFPPCTDPQAFFYGNVVSRTENPNGTVTFIIDSEAAPDNTQAVRWWPGEPGFNTCCEVLEFACLNPAPGSTPGYTYWECTTGTQVESSVFIGGCAAAWQYIQNFALTTPFQMTMTIGAGC